MNSFKDSYTLNKFPSYNTKPNSAIINRPMSALNKKSEFLSIHRSKKNLQEFPNLISNEIFNSNKSITSSGVEKEKLYEELIYYKNLVNNLKKELSLQKSQNAKKDTEINKKDKVIEDIVIDSQNSLYAGPREGENVLTKAKEANLISKMKKQFRQLKKEYEEKINETENLKKMQKTTKINELNIEIKTLNEEMSKLKTLYLHSLQQNEIHENNLKEMKTLQENFSKQHFIILNFQETLHKTNDELKSKNSEIDSLKDSLSKNNKIIDKLKKEIAFSNQMKEKFFSRDNLEKNEVASLQKKHEKQIAEMNKEINRYREIADKKDRNIRELESMIKKSKQGGDKANTFSYKEIKYIQENPEEKYDNMTHLLKSKLMEALTEKENLEQRVKKLEEKLKNYESSSDHISVRTGAIFSQSNRFSIDDGNFVTEEQLTDFTYYLIKNFEARKITHNIAMKTILKDVNSLDEKNENEIGKFINDLIEKIAEVLNLKLESDRKNLDQYIKTLYIISEQKLDVFLEKFTSLFYNIKTYKSNDEINFRQSLYVHLKNYEEDFKQKIKKIDVNSTGLISFENLKKIFESINLQVDPEMIEYLIYYMKSSETEKMSFCDLNYEVVFTLMKNHSNLNSNNTEENVQDIKQYNEEEESEIVITSDNFNEKVENVLKQIDSHLRNSGLTVRELFKHIFNLNQIDEFKNRNEEVLHLKDFIDCLSAINITLIDIDLYCIYTKLKLVDDYDFVSIKLLEEELRKLNANPFDRVPNRNVDVLDVDINQLKDGEISLKNINQDFKNINELNLANVVEDDDDYDLDLDKEVVLDEGFLDENIDENRTETENKDNAVINTSS